MIFVLIKGKIPCALTIAGSDSGGGAGIQADLKTFAALGVHGMSAITAITAQNTVELMAVHPVSPEIVKQQIEAVATDIGVDAAKTGMLYSTEIIKVVVEEVKTHGFPVVVDPVMIAKSGASLLREDAKRTLINELIPLATVVTPNAMEAQEITGIKIQDIKDAELAARKIAELGAKSVVVKGGHILQGGKAVDVLYHDGKYHYFESERLESKTTHGTGCSFAAAIAAELAKGKNIVEAVEIAKKIVNMGIKFGLNIGRGFGPVNPMAELYKEASKYKVLKNVKEAIKILEDNSEVSSLVPEVRMNLVMALPYAETLDDVVGVDGRITIVNGRAKAAACPEFGVSRHLAKYVLTAMKYDSSIRAAINIRYSLDILNICKKLGLSVSFYDRRKEPEEIKKIEGMSVPWGVEQAIRNIGKVPNVIYHEGDWGKEPMIVLLGENAINVAKLAIKIAKNLAKFLK